jgi:opacity protein-like surface antigen
MMKKLIFVLAASFFLIQFADAQLFQYGIKAGVGFSSLKIDDLAITDGGDAYDLITGDKVVGYHVGIQTQINIAIVVIKPELYFNAGGGSIEQFEDNGVVGVMDVKFNRIDLPVLVGVKLGPARINVGPVGSYVISESITNDIASIPADYKVFNSSLTWGFQAGVGVDLLKKLSIDARYEGSLSKLGETLTIGNADFELDARPSQWIISLGYWF